VTLPGRVAFVVPGGLAAETGGNLYDRLTIAELDRRGWSATVVEPGHPVDGYDVVVVDSLAMRFGPPRPGGVLVVLLHQIPSDAEHRPDWLEAEAETISRAEVIVTVSEWLARLVRSRTAAPVVSIQPGWDRAAASGSDDPGQRHDVRRDLVLSVANAHPGKGIPDAVRAFAGSGCDLGLVLVGDPARDPGEASRLRAAIADCDRSVTLNGVLPAPALRELYARARVFLTASRYEGWPIAVAEAMASGVPVAGFDVPGVAELVRDGRDGVLVPAGDVGALAEAITAVSTDAGVATRLGRAARERARGWPTWEDTTRSFADHVITLAEAARGRGRSSRHATGPR
jgi:glycosyltransferase involved in cell wall biosynthesis